LSTGVTPTGRFFGPRQHGMPTFGACSSVHIWLNTASPAVCSPPVPGCGSGRCASH
jgi:hypothetical protein